MKYLRIRLLMSAVVMVLAATSCNDNNMGAATDGTANDTDRVNTRRNSTDTSNYLTKDSGNQSQDVVDPNPPQNSRY